MRSAVDESAKQERRALRIKQEVADSLSHSFKLFEYQAIQLQRSMRVCLAVKVLKTGLLSSDQKE